MRHNCIKITWAIELGGIDITHVTATLAKFMSSLHNGRLKAVISYKSICISEKTAKGMHQNGHK